MDYLSLKTWIIHVKRGLSNFQKLDNLGDLGTEGTP
jgi:hypothetical protein